MGQAKGPGLTHWAKGPGPWDRAQRWAGPKGPSPFGRAQRSRPFVPGPGPQVDPTRIMRMCRGSARDIQEPCELLAAVPDYSGKQQTCCRKSMRTYPISVWSSRDNAITLRDLCDYVATIRVCFRKCPANWGCGGSEK